MAKPIRGDHAGPTPTPGAIQFTPSMLPKPHSTRLNRFAPIPIPIRINPSALAGSPRDQKRTGTAKAGFKIAVGRKSVHRREDILSRICGFIYRSEGYIEQKLPAHDLTSGFVKDNMFITDNPQFSEQFNRTIEFRFRTRLVEKVKQ